MGWTQYYDAPKPTKDFLIGQIEWTQPDGTQYYRVLDYAGSLTVAWMAVECLTDHVYPKGSVFATVTLLRHSRDGSLTTKDLSESMGPGEFACPERILALLSPIEDIYGPIEFKQQCDNHWNCEYSGPEYEGKRTDWDKPHTNQRTVEDGSAAWAKQWREGVREYHAKRSLARKVKPGSKVRFAKALRFTDGSEASEFEFIKGNLFRAGYSRVRITGWRSMEFEVAA